MNESRKSGSDNMRHLIDRMLQEAALGNIATAQDIAAELGVELERDDMVADVTDDKSILFREVHMSIPQTCKNIEISFEIAGVIED